MSNMEEVIDRLHVYIIRTLMTTILSITTEKWILVNGLFRALE